jgi:glycosyltransferase involved in cell wall biosynthesis
MRVLLANTTCKLGGVSTFMLSLRRGLVAAGHECDLFFFERGSMEPHLPADWRIHYGTLADCMRLVATERVDVVHANNVDWATGISAVRRIGAKLIVTAHKVRDAARCYGWTTTNCDSLTAVSDGLRQELEAYTDLPVQVVHSGIDTQVFSPDERPRTAPPIVAWVGRSASLVKRLALFAAAAPALRAAGFRIWVVDQHNPAQAAELVPAAVATLRPLAEFWGAVPSDVMPDLYRMIAASGGAVVSTSEREGLGLSLLEAQACACLAIGPDAAGVNESVSPSHGGVLYPRDIAPTALAALIAVTLRDRRHADALRQRASEFVREQFSRAEMTRQYLAIYCDAPFGPPGSALERARRRLRLSPLFNWNAYLEQRWGVGQKQYSASREFFRRGERRLSAAAAREAIRTSPTLYMRPGRLAHLISTSLLANST